jgi:hypothetical protein
VEPASILRYLADLAAGSNQRTSQLPGGVPAEVLDLTRTGEQSEWLGTSVLPLARVLDQGRPGAVPGAPLATSLPRGPTVRRLAALDALQPTEHLLRLGWVVVSGRIEVDGRQVTYCFPLISQPVRLLAAGHMQSVAVVPVGAPELTPLVADPTVAAGLEATAEHGGGALVPGDPHGVPSAALIARLPRLQAWIRAVVQGAELPDVRAVLPPTVDPRAHRTDDGLAAVVGTMLYVDRDLFRPGVEASLRSWANRPGTEETAFAQLYDPRPAPAEAPDAPVCSPLRLSSAQATAVMHARRDPMTVISGPPGSGKSHTVAAIAGDAVAQGASVLIATRSEHAAEVVASLLARQAGPDPVRFGGTQNDDIVRQSTAAGTTRSDRATAQRALDDARARQPLAELAVTRALDLEQRAARAESWDGLVGELTTVAPGAFEPAGDLDELDARLAQCEAPVAGSWWRRWRAGRAARRVRADLRAAPTAGLADLRAAPTAGLADLRTAVRCAADRRAAADLAARQGTVLAPAWAQLAAADEAVRHAAGRVAEVESGREDRRRRGRGAANDLATALRAGRRQRRRLLRELDGPGIVQALPLWVGTLRDVEDLLPDTPGLFDLVVLDEASQIDQLSAAGALLRARRAVVVGDPRQLRHVSFVSDDLVARTLGAHGLTALAARLDVRRASVLDVAAGTAPVTWLDEHHRSVPHLIDFSARRFYDGRLFVATRHPGNESTDVIDVERVTADAGDAAAAELEAALARVARLADEGRTDIAIVTPFREVADAAQDALLARYDVDAVSRLRLRVGTVHAFQGAEADHVVLVLGLGADDAAGRRRFVEDPHLFNVMVTRARRTLVVVTSLPPVDRSSTSGLVEQYLAHADRPPPPAAPVDGAAVAPWTASLARELGAAGVTARTSYPVGRWTVDVCLGDGETALGLDTGVHPDGATAHIARHRMLGAAGWRLLDAYATRWDGDATAAAVEFATLVRSVPAPAP